MLAGLMSRGRYLFCEPRRERAELKPSRGAIDGSGPVRIPGSSALPSSSSIAMKFFRRVLHGIDGADARVVQRSDGPDSEPSRTRR